MAATGLDIRTEFSGKRVFVTGHTGFKGAWFIQFLKKLGAEVCAYALPADNPSLYLAMSGDNHCQSVNGDIRNAERLASTLEKFQPDYVFHLAAQSLVRESYANPLYTFDVNAIGTANLLHALKRCTAGCTAVIITTDKVYENNEWVYPYRETDPLGGFDPYSASKACAEIVTQSFVRSFFCQDRFSEHGVSIATARAGNVIGGGDWAKDRLIPDIARSLQAGEELIVRFPQATRPWQHVLEPLYAYLLLAAKLRAAPDKFSGGWNIGPELQDNISVRQVVETALDVWGSGNYRVEAPKEPLHEAGLLSLDVSKARRELGWKPRYNALQAITITMAWYREYFANPYQATQLVDADIERFLKD